VSSQDESADRVVIAVDPHKASWTAAVVTSSLQPLATLRVPVSAAGYQQLRRLPAGGRRPAGRSKVLVGWVPRWPSACAVRALPWWTCPPSSPPGSGCCLGARPQKR
jgi:hypothetical protein